MGAYDEYKGIQLKVGPCEMIEFEPGDRVDLADGAYVGYGGVVIVKRGVFVSMVEKLYDKWGGEISLDALLDPSNPVHQALKEVTGERPQD